MVRAIGGKMLSRFSFTFFCTLMFIFSTLLFQNCGESKDLSLKSGSNQGTNGDPDKNDPVEEPLEEEPVATPTPELPVFSALNKISAGISETTYSLKHTSDGGYVTAGRIATDHATPDTNNIFFAKWNSVGVLEYSRSIGGNLNDQAFDIIELNDSYMLVGLLKSFQPAFRADDAFIMKLNKATGAVMMSKVIFGDGDEQLRDIEFYTDSNAMQALVGAGYTSVVNDGLEDGLVMKFDLNGNVIWQVALSDGTNNIRFNDAVHVPNQGIYAVGYLNDGTQDDAIIVRLSEAGALLGAKVMGQAGSDRFNEVEYANNQLVIGSKIGNLGFGASDGALVRMDASLNVLSTTLVGGSMFDEFTAVKVTSGGIVLLGNTASTGNGLNDVMVVKLDDDNKLSFATVYGGGGDDGSFFGSLDMRADGGIAVTARVMESAVAGDSDMASLDAALLLLDQFGNIDGSCTGVIENQVFGVTNINLAATDKTLTTSNAAHLSIEDFTVAALNANAVNTNQCN